MHRLAMTGRLPARLPRLTCLLLARSMASRLAEPVIIISKEH